MWFVLVWFYDILEFRRWKVNLRCLRLTKDIKNHIVIINEGNKQGSKALERLGLRNTKLRNGGGFLSKTLHLQMRNQQQTTDTLSFVIIPKMFWRNLTKIGKIYIPYEFAQSGCIPHKI